MARKWAVSIGINHYANMPDLDFAKRDAEKMRDWFAASGFDSIYLFTDDSPPIDDASEPYDSTPTGNILKRFFRIRFKPNILNIEDSIWFFFSGHGLRHEGTDYLMPCDADSHPEGIEETAIPLNYLTTRLRESGAGDVVIIYDACRNKSKAGGRGFGTVKTKGVITLASCSANERSYEIDAPEIQQGSFTYALLEALENTQLGRENYATFDRLYQRLRYRVPELNRQYDKPTTQQPWGYVEPDEKRYCILLPNAATTQDIIIYKNQALNAEINNNLREAERLLIQLWEICPGDPEIRQQYNRVILKKEQQLASKISNHPQPNTAGVKLARATAKTETQEPSSETTATNREKEGVFPFEVITVNKSGQEIKRESRQAEYFREDLGNNVTLEMVSIPGGKFLMGTEEEEIERLVKKFDWEGYRREKPQYEVRVKSFFMGKYPVTQAQWQAVMGNNPAEFQDSPQNPVEQISLNDAIEFCQRLSQKTGRKYRLPSEAEWEYACRAVVSHQSSVISEELTVEEWNEQYHQPFHFGETITGELANYAANYTYAEEAAGEYRQKTTPVGSFPPNGFGLYDMHGNVWEWCADNWHDNYEGAPTDGSAWTTGGNKDYSPLRGGSWINDPGNCRSASRNKFFRGRDNFDDGVGFRVVSESGRTL